MNWSVYSSLPLLALAPEHLAEAVSAFTEAHGQPARAQLHPQNAKLAHVLEQMGVAVEYSGGVGLWELRLADGSQTSALSTPLRQDGASEASVASEHLFGLDLAQTGGLPCQGRLSL